MTKDKLIKELELGLKNPNVPDTFKDKIRIKLATLKAEESKKETKPTTTRKTNLKTKFKVGDVVANQSTKNIGIVLDVFESGNDLRTDADGVVDLSDLEIYDKNKHGDFNIAPSIKSKIEPSNEDILAILYNADNKGYSATKADSGGTIRSSDELTEKYANAVSKNLTGIEKGSLSEEIYDELVDGNNHLLNEFLAWNGYYNSETSKSLKKMYQGIWERGNRQAANPEIITLGSDKKIKPTTATPIKKAHKKYIANREIKSVTILEDGKKVTYSGKDVLNGANFFKEGGVLTSKATYVPIRNIVEVTFEDGSTDKPRNGYHIKNGATPIMEHGGEVSKHSTQLVPLELEPLSNQLKSHTGDSLTSGDYTNEAGADYSTAPGEIIVHKESGKRFEMPAKIYDHVDGFNLVYDKNKSKIVTWEEGKLVAEVKEGKLDFSNKDESISINKTKVESEFEKGFIPEKTNEKWAYIAIENKLQTLYGIAEDLEDDKTTSAWRSNQSKIEKFEDFLHRLERKYEHGGAVELPEGSLQHFQNYYLEKGGKVDKEYSLIGTKVKSDIRKQSGYVTGYNGNYVDVYYPSLEFGESVLYKGKDQQNVMVVTDKPSLILNSVLKEDEFDNYFIEEIVEESTPIDEYEVKDSSSLIVLLRPKVSYKNDVFFGPIALIVTQKGFVYKIDNATFDKWDEIVKDAETDKLTDDKYGYVKIGNFLKEEYKLGGALLSAWKRERKYVNKSEDYEVRYAKGKNRKGYTKFAKGGPIPQKGDFAKVPVGYGMYHYGLIKGIIKDKPIYPQNGYEIVGIGDVLHPEQFKVVSQSEFEKQKQKGADVKTNSFLVIEEKFEKGGVLKVGDEVVDFDTMKHLGKVVEVSEINLDEDDIIIETPEGKTIKLNSFNVLRKPNVKANLGASPKEKLSIEELKAKHSVSNYGKGGKTDKEDPRGANFRLAKEIRQPGERWRDAVSRATKMLK